MGTGTQGRVVLALRQLLLSSYLFKHTPFNVLSLHIHWSEQAGGIPLLLSFFTPHVEVLLMVSGPVECICSGF